MVRIIKEPTRSVKAVLEPRAMAPKAVQRIAKYKLLVDWGVWGFPDGDGGGDWTDLRGLWRGRGRIVIR